MTDTNANRYANRIAKRSGSRNARTDVRTYEAQWCRLETNLSVEARARIEGDK